MWLAIEIQKHFKRQTDKHKNNLRSESIACRGQKKIWPKEDLQPKCR